MADFVQVDARTLFEEPFGRPVLGENMNQEILQRDDLGEVAERQRVPRGGQRCERFDRFGVAPAGVLRRREHEPCVLFHFPVAGPLHGGERFGEGLRARGVVPLFEMEQSQRVIERAEPARPRCCPGPNARPGAWPACRAAPPLRSVRHVAGFAPRVPAPRSGRPGRRAVRSTPLRGGSASRPRSDSPAGCRLGPRGDTTRPCRRVRDGRCPPSAGCATRCPELRSRSVRPPRAAVAVPGAARREQRWKKYGENRRFHADAKNTQYFPDKFLFLRRRLKRNSDGRYDAQDQQGRGPQPANGGLWPTGAVLHARLCGQGRLLDPRTDSQLVTIFPEGRS